MHWKRRLWTASMLCVACAAGRAAHAQAALLMEAPFGFAGALNPTGHDAIYFTRICAATPVKLRRCRPGEDGAVIARYNKVGGYDWLAIPLGPYLYAVEHLSAAPKWADRDEVRNMRKKYLEAHFNGFPVESPGKPWPEGYWYQLVGSSYDRRIYAFRFNTTEEQDDALIAKLNSEPNRTRFSLVRNNCADFSAMVLDFYLPGVFHRRVLPDARITTPRQNSWELVNYAKKHPEIQLSVMEIPQVPGSRRSLRRSRSIAGALLMSGDLAPVALLCPPLAAVVCVDYLVWGRYPIQLKHVPKVTAEELVSATGNAAGGSDRRMAHDDRASTER
ncbi:MAG: hypothetical protein WAL75_07100 [Terracidiphilus sp.]